MNILGIDYGIKKIGLALAVTMLAEPLAVVKYRPSIFEIILRLCQQHQIERIVVGLPEGKIANRVKKFSSQLSLHTGLPVDFQDETLTSQQAIAKMIETGRGKKVRREFQDAVAAALILQDYLDRKINV